MIFYKLSYRLFVAVQANYSNRLPDSLSLKLFLLSFIDRALSLAQLNGAFLCFADRNIFPNHQIMASGLLSSQTTFYLKTFLGIVTNTTVA